MNAMKIRVIFLIAFVLGLAAVAYTVFEPPGGPSRYIVIASPDTQRMTDGDHVRTILFHRQRGYDHRRGCGGFLQGKSCGRALEYRLAGHGRSDVLAFSPLRVLPICYSRVLVRCCRSNVAL